MTTLPWLASNILLWQPCQDIMVLRWKFKSSAICWPSGGVCIQCKTMTKSYLLIFDICLHPQLPNQSENSYNFFLCKKVAGKREITILRKSWQCLINLMSWYGNTGAYWRSNARSQNGLNKQWQAGRQLGWQTGEGQAENSPLSLPRSTKNQRRMAGGTQNWSFPRHYSLRGRHPRARPRRKGALSEARMRIAQHRRLQGWSWWGRLGKTLLCTGQ